MDSPSAQLARELRAAVAREVSSRRPILHRLNNDTSYLLQLPRAAAAARQSGSRIFYNVLIDPWLAGGQSDTASWISQQWHSAKSAVESVKEVDRLAREIEALASNCDSGDEEDWVVADVLKNNNGAFTTGTYMPHEMVDEDETALDAVIISHEFTDHCHKRTLLSIHPDVPVFAPEVWWKMNWNGSTIVMPPLLILLLVGYCVYIGRCCTDDDMDTLSHRVHDPSLLTVPASIRLAFGLDPAITGMVRSG